MYRVYTVEWFVCLLFTSIIPLMHIHHPIQIFSLGNSRTVPSSQLSDPDMDAEEVRRPTGDELIYVQLWCDDVMYCTVWVVVHLPALLNYDVCLSMLSPLFVIYTALYSCWGHLFMICLNLIKLHHLPRWQRTHLEMWWWWWWWLSQTMRWWCDDDYHRQWDDVVVSKRSKLTSFVFAVPLTSIKLT